MSSGGEGSYGYRYPEGETPFGAMDFVVPKTSLSEPRIPFGIVLRADQIIMNAWATSDWLQRYVPADKLEDQEFLDEQPFAAAMHRNVEQAYYAKDHSFAMAVLPRPYRLYEVPRLGQSALGAIDLSRIVAVGNAKVDISGNAAAKILKQMLAPDKVYGCLSNVDVNPDHQGDHIGTALAYTLLGTLPQDKKATTYVIGQNEALVEKLRELDYGVTGSRPRKDLITGVEIEEARMEAESVRRVRQVMADRFPWLTQAVRFWL